MSDDTTQPGQPSRSGQPGEPTRSEDEAAPGRAGGEESLPVADHDTPGLGERISAQLAAQWALVRADRAAERDRPAPVIDAGRSNFSRAEVPWGIDLAAAWAWRFLVISAAVVVVAMTLARFSVVTLPLAISLLLAALVSPLVHGLTRIGIRRSVGALVGVLLTFGLVGALLTFAGQEVARGASDLADQVVTGLDRIRVWLKEGPLNASDSQINSYIKQVQDAIGDWSKNGALDQVGNIGTALGHLTAGFFIVLFAMYFFLADGERIWSWMVRLTPRAARAHVDSSGRVAWVSLTQFVRATVVVAMVDSLGIMAVAWFLDVPFLLAIGVLVFLGAFVPMVGATVAGLVAVLVALVDQGPVTALLMGLGVIVVQQIEGNVLQPFLMGRFVSIHPLGIIVAIAVGILVAGIAGGLIAVPLVAALNAVVLHLADNVTAEDVARTEHEEQQTAPSA